MTNTSEVQSSAGNRRNRFIAYLLVAAALVSATKDINRLGTFASWVQSGLASVYASNVPASRSCSRTPEVVALATVGKATDIALDRAAENNEVLDNEPEIGGEVAIANFIKAGHASSVTVPGRAREPRATTVHLDRRAVNDLVAVRFAHSDLLRAWELKSLSRSFTIELPSPPVAKDDTPVQVEALPDTPACPMARVLRRHVSNPEREFNFKTMNVVFRTRRAS
jgi:hypothetical protein